MEKIQLKTKVRDFKANAKQLRETGDLPAVLYGHNVKNMSLAIKKSDFEKAFKKAGESSIIDLITDDGKTHPVLIHDVQLHFLTTEPTHVDFYQVSMTEKLRAKVAVEFVGEAPAVKTLGGVLVKVLNEIEVQCLPADLPHNIPADISCLTDYSSSILVKNLKLDNKVQVLTSGDEVVVKVQPPRDVEAELAVPADEKAAVEAAVAASEKPKEAEGEEAVAEEKDKPPKAETKKQ